MDLYVYYYDKILSASTSARRVRIEDLGESTGLSMIGSHDRATIRLGGTLIPEIVAGISLDQNTWVLKTIAAGTEFRIDGAKVEPGRCFRIEDGQTLEVFPFVITFRFETEPADPENQENFVLNERTMDLIRGVHRELVPQIAEEWAELDDVQRQTEFLVHLEQNIERLAMASPMMEQRLIEHIAGLCVKGELLAACLKPVAGEHGGEPNADVWHKNTQWRNLASLIRESEQELVHLVSRVGSDLGFPLANSRYTRTEVGRHLQILGESFWPYWKKHGPRRPGDFKLYLALRQIKKDIKDIVYGYGPLEDLIHDPDISEIMVVNKDRIYVERFGLIENSGRRFVSDQVTEAIIQRMINAVGGHIDRSKPMADARLRDGSRINAVIAPLAVSGSCLTIRKFGTDRWTMENLIEKEAITEEAAEFLRAAVRAKCNVLVSGGTGTGKTTFLNILSNFVHDHERIVTIEDVAELRLRKEHIVRLETKAQNIEGKGEITIRDLVKNALRMRPDRIIVGECRSGEALDMLQAMNTGHDGSMTTIHANSSEGVISRLIVLVQMARDSQLTESTIYRQIESAIDLIVQLKREGDGRRRVVQISEAVDLDPVTGKVRLRDIFFASPDGPLRPTGRLPSFLGRMMEQGLIRLETFLPLCRKGNEVAIHR